MPEQRRAARPAPKMPKARFANARWRRIRAGRSVPKPLRVACAIEQWMIFDRRRWQRRPILMAKQAVRRRLGLLAHRWYFESDNEANR